MSAKAPQPLPEKAARPQAPKAPPSPLDRAARAERHLAYLEDFARRHGKADDGEGLIEFFSRTHYRAGLDDSNAGRWLKLMHLDKIDHVSIDVKNCDLIPAYLDECETLGEALDKMRLPV